MAIGNSLVTTLYLGREPTYNTFPCFLNIWVSSIGTPLWLTSVAGRFVRLAFLYHFSQAKLVAGSKGAQYIHVGPEKSNLSLEQYAESMVEDPQQFEVFKRFSQRDFSVENVLFFERIQKFRHHTSDIIGEGTLPTWVILEINSIYSIFFAADSEFVLNLEALTVREIRHRFQTGGICPDIFNRALNEIRTLIFRYTYARYVRLGQQGLAKTVL
ncbi:hypothetical protein K493DRAFT_361934 [Basidiobolus meristosporus CBS 931.73]|uniref:RGS domain-containing protein n=1 Tax=Basidiobolus meristosporus CBS 931.73 TaxID=1314790 RepID=A0A1Y1X650_9FUNG|nr:hypothetical protein K493DRAFT_361934 [Basidiobolus meristosporus CBS 931.73]|eukprot:ORX81182.1 hypothetical protein K493DRAFT_361934 [Basidiobolus meristosporus CBS 931.73]